MAEGGSIEEFAGILSVSKQTIYNWTEMFPEFMDAKEIGEMKSRKWWTEQMRKGIWSESWSETGGSRSMNASIVRLNMANRFGWKDKVEMSGELDTSATRDKLKKLITSSDPKVAAAARTIALAMADSTSDNEDDE